MNRAEPEDEDEEEDKPKDKAKSDGAALRSGIGLAQFEPLQSGKNESNKQIWQRKKQHLSGAYLSNANRPFDLGFPFLVHFQQGSIFYFCGWLFQKKRVLLSGPRRPTAAVQRK